MLCVEDWLEQLSVARTADTAFAIASERLADLGLDRLIYLMVGGRAHPTRVYTTMPAWWLDQYQAEHLAEHDPFLSHCCNSLQPMATGPAYLSRYDFLDEDERTFIHKAGDAGMKAGVAIPIGVSGMSQVGGFNVGTALQKRELESIIATHGQSIRLGLLYTHAAMERLGFEPHPRLSPRQLECLQLLARGSQLKQIAETLGVGYSTVELHLRAAREKLGATTREQAVARAVALGWITGD